ncbi:MAG: PD-(D/E)XK nuclease family protein [Thermodesulfovibrionales bacterium]
MVTLKTLNFDDDPIEYIAQNTLDDPTSYLAVFPTARNIRHFHNKLSILKAGDTAVSPYCYDVNRFISLCLDADGSALIPRQLRPFYLHKAIGKMKRERLDELFKGGAAEMQNDFIDFASTGGRILRFYDELFAEMIKTSDLKKASLYTDYERHITILDEMIKVYEEMLHQDGFTDAMFLKKEMKVRTGWLERFHKIYFLLGGYLTRFEIELLKRIGDEKDLEISLGYEGRPDEQIKKIFNHFNAEPETLKTSHLPSAIEIRAFDEVTGQFGLVMHGVERALSSGIEPEDIAVVLPDESFKRILSGLDRNRIFNFAMGLDLRDSLWYSFLKVTELLFIDRVNGPYFRSDGTIAFLKHPFIANLTPDRRWIDDLISGFKRHNKLVLKEQDFCTKDEIKDLFMQITSLMSTERRYDEFCLSIAAFFENLLTTVEPGFMDSILKSPDFNEAHKALINHLYQSAVMPFDCVYSGSDPLHHLVYLNSQLERLTYNDVAGGFITVMGMLETRNINFKAVIVPDMNEEIMPPGNEKEMFLNTRIREELGIPTYRDRENLARHYFTVLVKNADMVFLSYVDRDERPIRSRFIEEILIQQGHKGDDPQWLEEKRQYEDLIFTVKNGKAGPPLSDVIPKDEDALKRIEEMSYTPYKLRTYRLCSYKFYLLHIKGLEEPAEITEELEARDIGNLVHNALKNVYEREKSFSDPHTLHDMIREEVTKASGSCDILKISAHAVFERDILVDKLYQFALNEIKRFEGGWRPEILEHKVELKKDGLTYSGRIDRVDVRKEEGMRHAVIIDYKFSNVRRLKTMVYDEDFFEFQLPLYRMMLKEEYPDLKVDGFGYYDLKDTFGLVMVTEKGSEEDFLSLLDDVTGEICSSNTDFVKTDDLSICMYCGFARICGRK